MPDVRLPGPLVFHPEVPALSDDPTGGMPLDEMVRIVARIDAPAALLAAVGARFVITYADGPADQRQWTEDAEMACCADTVTFVEHRISLEHLGNRFPDIRRDALSLLTTRSGINDDLDPARHLTADEARIAAEDADAEARMTLHEDSLSLISALQDFMLGCETTEEAYFRVPFLALDVPEMRIAAYERAGLTWAEALTFETYEPPSTLRELAALQAEALRRPIIAGRRRGHLTLVK